MSVRLSDLPERLFSGLLAKGKPRQLAADEVLFTSGDPGDGFYRLDEGLLKVSIASATGAERILAILGPGAIVGDLAIIDGLPRSASVTALRPSKLRFVSRTHNVRVPVVSAEETLQRMAATLSRTCPHRMARSEALSPTARSA